MELKDMNPFLRFVQIIKYQTESEYLRAVDYHFYFMLSDYCLLKIDNTDYTLQAGSAVIIPPGTKYRFTVQKEIRLVSINFDYTQHFSHCVKEVHPISAEAFRPELIIETVNFEDCPFLNAPLVLKNLSHLSKAVDAVLDEFTYKKQLFRIAASAAFKNVLISIARAVICDEKGSDAVNLILDYIHGHYAENIINETLSQIAGYHPGHLNRLMKKATGVTLRQYLINYRIETAKHFLRDTSHPIAKIAELCGYHNFCNFSTDFKRKTGLTPNAYRLETHHLL